MRILFVCQNDFRAPSEKQALGFAQQLLARGHTVAIAIGGEVATAEEEGAAETPGLLVNAYRFAVGGPRRSDLRWARRFRPTLIHAFNSRTATVAVASSFSHATGAPVFVHFEDDEWRPHPPVPGDTPYHLVGRQARRLASPVIPGAYTHSTRRSLRWVRRNARALDALTPALAAEVSRRLGRECAVVLPVTPQAGRMRPSTPQGGGGTTASTASRWPDAPTALFTGTVWPVYLPDVMVAMRAVAEVRRRGAPLHFVHAGRVHPRLDIGRLAREAGLDGRAATFLGYLPFGSVHGLLRRASILLQPGPPSEFNRLRLPAKMQAYLESGTPTITYAVGFGELLGDRQEVLKTYTADAGELADRMSELLGDRELAARIGAGGVEAAKRLFDPRRNTDALLAHYTAGVRYEAAASSPSRASTAAT